MKILVIGDSCVDKFTYGICDRLSPEAPVPVFKPIDEKVNGGMALNVCQNILALGVECDFISNEKKPIKTRLVDKVSNQIIVRIDESDKIEQITPQQFNCIDFSVYDAVVVSDYNKGFLTNEIIEWITKEHNLVFLDTKKKLGTWSDGIEFLKLNEKEWKYNYDWLLNYDKGNVIVTRGGDGASLNFSKNFPIKLEHPVRDLSGAGDTFLAALVVKYLEKNNVNEAIRFANKCASWVVTQKGVVVIKPEMV